jgi:signal transduction histidine kinase
VADDGPGVPPGQRDHVFDRGYSAAEDGTGFGLAIVEEIATAHGWTVSVTESEAGGARFTVRPASGHGE